LLLQELQPQLGREIISNGNHPSIFSSKNLLADTTLTSQIVLINAQGVALASDSAVTMGDGRTFDTVNKVFSLGRQGKQWKHHIAFMISGGDSYTPGSILWERVIGLFSKHLEDTAPDLFSVNDYVDQFIDFVNNDSRLNIPTQNDIAVQSDLLNWFEDIPPVASKMKDSSAIGRLSSLVDYGAVADLDNVSAAVDERIEAFIENFLQFISDVKLDRANDNNWTQRLLRIESENGHNSRTMARAFVDSLQLTPIRESTRKLEEIFNFHLANSYRDFKGRNHSVIAIAGFGQDELVPMMVELKSGSIIDSQYGSIRIRRRYELRLQSNAYDHGELQERCDECGTELEPRVWVCDNHDPPRHVTLEILSAAAFLKPFAQKSEIQNTLNGFHEDLEFLYEKNKFPAVLTKKIEENIKLEMANIEGIGPRLMDRIDKAFAGHITEGMHSFIALELEDAIVNHGWIKRRQRFRNVVRGLPMKEMETFAKTLVELQAEITHYQSKIRGVGGEIDVARITKEEGFVWVNRQ